jgi:DNA-binding transcriptional regulator YdaS (Cro superfamily)
MGMKLSEYVEAAHGRQSSLAVAIGVQPQLVWQWSRNQRPVPSERCPSIERATAGQVTCEELRPDVDWARFDDPMWPGGRGRPCIDVAAPQAEAPNLAA